MCSFSCFVLTTFSKQLYLINAQIWLYNICLTYILCEVQALWVRDHCKSNPALFIVYRYLLYQIIDVTVVRNVSVVRKVVNGQSRLKIVRSNSRTTGPTCNHRSLGNFSSVWLESVDSKVLTSRMSIVYRITRFECTLTSRIVCWILCYEEGMFASPTDSHISCVKKLSNSRWPWFLLRIVLKVENHGST